MYVLFIGVPSLRGYSNNLHLFQMKADTAKQLFQQDHYLDVVLQNCRISSVGRALSLQAQGRRFEPTIRCILVAPAGAPKVVPRESSILLKICLNYFSLLLLLNLTFTTVPIFKVITV